MWRWVLWFSRYGQKCRVVSDEEWDTRSEAFWDMQERIVLGDHPDLPEDSIVERWLTEETDG